MINPVFWEKNNRYEATNIIIVIKAFKSLLATEAGIMLYFMKGKRPKKPTTAKKYCFIFHNYLILKYFHLPLI